MRVTHYTKAALGLLKDGKNIDTVFLSLKALLDKRGESRLYPAVLRSLQRSYQEHLKKHEAVIRVYDAKSAERISEAIKAELAKLNALETTRIVEDHTIIGGFSIVTADKRIDKTYKRQLIDLYRGVIH